MSASSTAFNAPQRSHQRAGGILASGPVEETEPPKQTPEAGSAAVRERYHIGGGLAVAGPSASSFGKGKDGSQEKAGSASQKSVAFDPPLYLQRQQWLLTNLRKQGAKSILDIGCGEGSLLTALSRPPISADAFPIDRFKVLRDAAKAAEAPADEPDTGATVSSNPATSSALLDAIRGASSDTAPSLASAAVTSNASTLLPQQSWVFSSALADLSPSQLTGLDLSEQYLLEAKDAIDGVLKAAEARKELRWQDLKVKLLRGNLAQHDESLVGYDAVVATEIIEHLDEPILHAFGPAVLGRLKPKMLLLTTPNYAFHVHFNRDPANEGDPGFLDPTGKTARRFRHSDHKFEWTTGEFKQWCNRVANEYGYEVEVGGVGVAIYPPEVKDEERATAKDIEAEVGIDEDDEDSIKFASQTAVFKLKQKYDDKAGGGSFPSTSTSESGSTSSSRHGSIGRSTHRRARSRQPEHLPFLSDVNLSPLPDSAPSTTFDSTETTSPMTSSVSTLGPAATTQENGTSPTRSGKKDGSPSHAHQIIYEHFSAGVLPPEHQPVSRGEGDDEAEHDHDEDEPNVATDEEVEDNVLHRMDTLTSAALSGSQKYVRARLWDVWVEDFMRISCRGRMSVLFDALRLDEPTAASTSPKPAKALSRFGTLVACSPDHAWSLRIWSPSSKAAKPEPNDLWLFYTGAEMDDWELPGGIAEIVDDDADEEDFDEVE